MGKSSGEEKGYGMKYAYWSVICKTPECGNRHYAKLIGESEGRTNYLLQGDLPQEFHYHCEKCGIDHSYTVDDMVSVEIDPPALSGLREWW